MGVNTKHMIHTITAVGAATQWNGQHGPMFEIAITLDSGDEGYVNAKTADRWKPGDRVVILSDRKSQHGRKWKLDRPEEDRPQTGGNTPRPYSGQSTFDERGNKIDASWAIGQLISLYGPKVSKMEPTELKKEALDLIALRNLIVTDLKAKGSDLSGQEATIAPSPAPTTDESPF